VQPIGALGEVDDVAGSAPSGVRTVGVSLRTKNISSTPE
jgi:hypothetical protein